MIACPVCQSEDVRASWSTRITDVFHRLRGRVPFRCRQCRQRFFAALSVAEKQQHAAELTESRSFKHHRSVQSMERLNFLMVVISIFAVAVMLFLLFLRALTTESQPEQGSKIACALPESLPGQDGQRAKST